MSGENKSVERLTVNDCTLDCPHCDARQDGWLIDPRGRNHECDECGKTYHVPSDVRMQF
jgi:hypothetical protein